MSTSKLVKSNGTANGNSNGALFAHNSMPSNHNSAVIGAGGGAPNIWQLMNYPVPRGKCVHKPSVLSSSCPCLRFMLNPLQAASSFACDGCGHHASFHNLKNAEEEGEGYVPEPQKAARKRSATEGRGVGMLLSSGSEDEEVQVLEGDLLQVVKRSRGA
ncbi:hypothetical protein BDD12DRAFT_909854 [Trichophaea hybrida]|nr:hypothetical protein BDD12DRAFT_909854 [Trichophaea hybrida]